MNESIEDIARRDPAMTIEMIPFADIDFEPGNPNALSDATYEALKAEIRDVGFAQPVAVWRRPGGRWKMIDGEHRARILDELGYDTVPAVVLEAKDEDEAKVRLLTLNGLRGEFLPIKMAYFLQDLTRRVPEAELRRRLGMEPGEMRDLLRLAEFTDPMADRLREATEREAKDAPVVLKFVVSKRDQQVIERVIDKLVKGKIDRGTALAKVCREFEKLQREAE